MEEQKDPQAEETPTTEAELKYPNADISISRLTTSERTGGALDREYIRNLRKSPFFFRETRTSTGSTVISPSRAQMELSILDRAPDFHFPAVLIEHLHGKPVTLLSNARTKPTATDETKISFKKVFIQKSKEEKEEGKESSDDDESEGTDLDEIGQEYGMADVIDDEDDDQDDGDNSSDGGD